VPHRTGGDSVITQVSVAWMLYKPPHGSPSRVVVAQVIERGISHMVGTAWTKVYQGNTRNVARTSPGHQKVLSDQGFLNMMICTRREW
jgi:hypothetical protein